MKISQIQENLTPASTPSVKTIAPKFGRSDEMLESDCGTTGSSSIATVSAPMGKMQKRGKGSMFTGIQTSEKFANSRKAGIKESYYNHDDNRTGFSKPVRQDDERNSEFDDKMRKLTGMIFYNVDDTELAQQLGLKQTRTGKWFLRTGNRMAQQVADRAFGPGKVWYPQNESVEGVAEMDGDGAGRDGSNRKSHSTYGSRDKHTVSNGPDVHLGPKNMMTSKDMQDRALDTLKKTMSKPENMAVLNRLKTKEGVAEGSESGAKILYTGKDKSGTVTISYEPDYIPGHSEKYIIRFNGKVKSKMPTLRSAVYGLTHYQFDTFRPNLQPNPKTALEQGVAEGSTTRGGFGGSASQAQHEIQWLKNKIETLKPLLAKKPSVARQIKDLERQIRERELAISYQKEGVAEGSRDDDEYGPKAREEWLKQQAYEKEYNKKKPSTPVKPANKNKEQGVAEGSNDTIYPNAEVIKSRNGKPVGEIYQDAHGWGCFHYKADNGADSIETREEALEWLKDIAEEYRQNRSLREQGVAEGEQRMSRAAKGNEKYGKDGMKALAKAGRDGASEEKMDKIRDKHDNYNESWSQKYKSSINCSNPKGFSQKAHCAGKKNNESVEEEFNPEYDDEAGMAETNLHTIARAAQGLIDAIGENENLPEWCQDKIAKVEGMLVAVWNYLESQEEEGIDPQVDETAAWQKKSGKNKNGGLNKKGVASYRREHPGSKLQTAVTTKPSKLKPGSKAANRRKSFCARMGGMKGPMKDKHGKPTRKALSLRKWHCESVEQTVQILESVQHDLAEMKQRLDPKCWKGFKKQGTKMKGNTRVNNCVPVSEAEVSEDKLAGDLYKDFQIFKKGDDKGIGSKAKAKDISSKAKDKDIIAKEGAKVDRMVGHVKSSEKKLGHSDKEAENIAWATANKRGMLNNKNKK